MSRMTITPGYPVYFLSAARDGISCSVTVPNIVSVENAGVLGAKVTGVSPGTTEVCLHRDGVEYRRVEIVVTPA